MLWRIIGTQLGAVIHIGFFLAGIAGAVSLLHGRARLLTLLLCVVAAYAVYLRDPFNATTVSFHMAVTGVVFGAVFWLMEKFGAPPASWLKALPIVLASAYMGYGWWSCHTMAATHYKIASDKDLGGWDLRIAQISDVHLGATFSTDGLAKRLRQISKVMPDMLVVTGDFVDDDTTREEMLAAAEMLGKFRSQFGTFFVLGNHDRGYRNMAFTSQELVDALSAAGVKVLLDTGYHLTGNVYVIGRLDARYKRKSVPELMQNAPKDAYVVMLDHQPRDYQAQQEAGVDLVLSGHTHGGQLFGLHWLISRYADMVYGHERKGGTDFVVTSGISDWKMRFKTAKPSEYVFVEVAGKKKP